MLVAILFLLKTEEEKTKVRPPNVIYEVVLTWNGESNDDALGKARNNTLPNENGVVVNYNEEVVSFRGVTQGENIVTVHVYSKTDPDPVKATIKLIKIKPFKEIVVKERVFETVGEEKTAFRFTTDKNGDIVDISELPANLVRPLGQ